MFDVGFTELLLILVVTLVAVGPKDLPQLMFKMGRFFRAARLVTQRWQDTLNETLHDVEVETYRQQIKAQKLADEAASDVPLETPVRADDNK